MKFDGSFLSDILNAIPAFIFIVDEDMHILEWNRMADRICGEKRDSILKTRGGDFVCCINDRDWSRIGQQEKCEACVLRRSVKHALQTWREVKAGARMEVRSESGVDSFYALVSATPIKKDGESAVVLIVQDFGVAADLDRNVPVCSTCHRVRNAEGRWEMMEGFLKRNFGVDCSHGICPECLEREMRDMDRIFAS